jgi:hypothetical protein
MRSIDHIGAPADVATTVESQQRDARRPLLIEYAPQSPPVSPFRGLIRAPSLYEAD